LTWVSEGKDFRRLRVTLKAGEVFEIADLAHDTPPSIKTRPVAAAASYHMPGTLQSQRHMSWTAVWRPHTFWQLAAGTAQRFVTDLLGAFEAIPVVTGGELIIPRLVFTKLVLISASTRKIAANKHRTAIKPVRPGLWRRLPGAFS
jgi:hypothetical protein